MFRRIAVFEDDDADGLPAPAPPSLLATELFCLFSFSTFSSFCFSSSSFSSGCCDSLAASSLFDSPPSFISAMQLDEPVVLSVDMFRFVILLVTRWPQTNRGTRPDDILIESISSRHDPRSELRNERPLHRLSLSALKSCKGGGDEKTKSVDCQIKFNLLPLTCSWLKTHVSLPLLPPTSIT